MTYFLISIGVVILILLGVRHWVLNSEPYLPKNIDALIQEIISSPLPELMTGESDFVQNGRIKIAYELLKTAQTKKGTILLINGHTQTLLEWPSYFYQPFLDAGYDVVRYDNRGFGMSDWLEDWGKNGKYTLEEMATDGIAVLDTLGIAKAHVIGASMGGMIGQSIAINHPDRIWSLTSIMSTGYYFDPMLTNVPKPFMRNLLKLILRYKRTMHLLESKLKFQLGIRHILKGKGDYQLDTKAILQQCFYEIKNRNGYHSKADLQHGYAIKKSGSRYEGLKNLTIPVLVVHGSDDTLILVNHAEKYSAMIPKSTLLILEGMGHDIPKKYAPEIIKKTQKIFAETSTGIA